ncbi:uncharacterized protein LOC107816181 isoform X2 [Nicotiana tabacum]|uniref:Uncharacterized protein LOC107816181 isoform X2 n=1 Tax=Nicotiana tabacum TaxID=4097 RepID=A0A1S4C8C9_TOBAC|nr:uncharacterized protein LOC104097613 isoform X2 [Nicotiana tomentosiformis]XP_016497366.1 PREDICTED: uncharacterized protein LOC107816181 isoform X2 [Nicotiana tabacum]
MFKQIGLKVGHWSHKKIVDPLLQILRRGAEPKQLAFSGALGVTLGVPVFMCGLAIAVLGSSCHAPTVFLANFIATPVELSLVIPFLRLGEAVSGGSHFALTSDALKKVLTGQASWEVLLSIFHALLGWLVATPFILAGLYVLFLPCFTLLVRKFSSGQPIKINSVPSSPKKIVSSSPKKAVQPLTEVRVKVRDV